jgi:5-methylcytosine-specific restriction enzyme A
VTPQQRERAYSLSRRVALGEVTRAVAVPDIAASGVPGASAAIIVDVYLALRKGAIFKRALADADMDRILAGIHQDDGVDALAAALNGFARHISYRESVGHAQRANRVLYAKYLALVSVPEVPASLTTASNDPLEDDGRESRRDSTAARQRRLSKAKRTPRLVPRIVFVFERNADVIAEVLEKAAGTFGICGSAAPFARASDGSPYLEVHHRIPLAQGGEDSVDNAVATCPNCHRQQHFG